MTTEEFDIIIKHVQKRGRKAPNTHKAARMVLVDGKTQADALRATGVAQGALWRSLRNIRKYRVCEHCSGVSDKR